MLETSQEGYSEKRIPNPVVYTETTFLAPSIGKLESLAYQEQWIMENSLKPGSIRDKYPLVSPNPISLLINYYAEVSLVKHHYGTYSKLEKDKIDFGVTDKTILRFYIYSPWDSMKNAQNQVTEYMNKYFPENEPKLYSTGLVIGLNEGLETYEYNEWDFDKVERVKNES